MNPLKAAIYARYSTDKQRETSIEDQFRLCQRYAQNEGFDVVAIYGDDSISGSTPVAHRSGGAKLLEDARANRIDALIVEGLDRISRDQVEQERIVRRLEHQGINIIGLADGYDSRMGSSRKVLRGIRGLINEMYLEDLRHKTHRGQDGQVTRGYTAGGLAYGYRSVREKNGSRYEIVEEQAQWVRWIFSKYAEDWSIQRITHELNLLQAPSPRGSSWAISSIYGSPAKGTGILNNQLYIGQYVWNRSQWIKDPDTGVPKRIERPLSEWRIVASPHLRIISDELWQAARKRMGSPNTSNKGRPPSSLLGGLMRCPKCGGPLIATSKRHYGCNIHKDRGPTLCSGFYIPRELTETRLVEIIKQDLLSTEAQQAITSQLDTILFERNTTQREMASSSQTRLSKLNQEIARLVEAIAEIGISPALQTRLQTAEMERQEIVNWREKRDNSANASKQKMAATIKHLITELQSALKQDTQRSRKIISALMGDIKLIVRKDGIYAEYDGNPEKILHSDGRIDK